MSSGGAESSRVVRLRRNLHIALAQVHRHINSDAVKPCFRHLKDPKLVAAAEDLTAQMMVQVADNVKSEFEQIMSEYNLNERMLALDEIERRARAAAASEGGDGGGGDGVWVLPEDVSPTDVLRVLAVRSLRAERERLEAELAKKEAEARALRGAVVADARAVKGSADALRQSLGDVGAAADAMKL